MIGQQRIKLQVKSRKRERSAETVIAQADAQYRVNSK